MSNFIKSHTKEETSKSDKHKNTSSINQSSQDLILETVHREFWSESFACQKKSAAEGRRRGVLLGGSLLIGVFFVLVGVFLLRMGVFLEAAGVFFTLEDRGVGGDFRTPNLGFCSGSKGTLEEPSGLTRRLRSVFLNSVKQWKWK